MNEIIIRGKTFSIGKVDALSQLYLSRTSMPFFLKWTAKDGISFDQALSEIPEADMQGMFDRLLPFVTMQVDGNWFPIWNKQAKAFMYEDAIDGATCLKLLYFALEIYIKPFLDEPDLEG
jgi:hypothetical protein